MKTQAQLESEMTPALQVLYQAFKKEMLFAGIPFELNEVLRTSAVQQAYYAQGRNPLAQVNNARKAAGLGPISQTENQYKVTWTLNSRHFAGKDGLSRAFDIRLLNHGKPTWDTKWDANQNSIPDYREAALIGQRVGLAPGALWDKPDYPHYQLPE